MTETITADEYNAMQAKKKANKYRNKPVVIDGITFHSTAEGNRYVELKRLQDAGEIRLLTLQPRAVLEVNGVKVGTYVGDFKYLDPATGQFVIEDVKGVKTPVYRLKKKLVKALYGIEIKETSA